MSVFTNPASGSAEHATAYTAAVLGLLGAREPMEVLRATPADLRAAFAGLSDAELSAPEAPGKWSMQQVAGHLADSELVWGYRLRMVLGQDRPPLTGYDQDEWARRLHYDDAPIADSLDEFEILRRSNLRLLGRAKPEDLQRVGVHAERGDESVGHMIRLYAGHDLLHLRQLDRIRTRRLITTGSTFEAEIGFSRAVVDGDWVFVSGTTGFDYATMTIGTTVVEQAEQCLRNIESVLAKAGSSLRDVVRVTYILPNVKDFQECWPALRRHFGETRPAATMISAGLVDSRMLIEIEVTARKTRRGGA